MSYDQKRVVDAIRAFEAGEIVVVMDDNDRENEGDLIVAAVHTTPEKMAFIVRHTSGIVCAPMPKEEAKRLNLNAMVAENDSAHTTAFTVSVDFKHGTTTGISADDRTLTVRNLANPNVGAADFVRPGHIFPLVSREGGVLMRSGHTEAAVDLCRLAGLPPIGVISELVNDDGTVTRGPQVVEFAEKHGLKLVSVADLIAYRQRKETLIEQGASFDIDTPFGKAKAHTYALPWDPMQHLAVVFGDIRDASISRCACIRKTSPRISSAGIARSISTCRRLPRKAAASSSICARAPSASATPTTAARPAARAAKPMPKPSRARANGWKSASAHKSSRTSASARSSS